jgi:hypothetical protein
MSPPKYASWFPEDPPNAAEARRWCILAGLIVAVFLVWAVAHTKPFRYNYRWKPQDRFVSLGWYADDLVSPDPALRAKAARLLDGRANFCDVSDLLLPALDDPSPAVRRYAAMGIIQTYKAHGVLLKAPLPAIQQAFDRRLRLETNRRVLNVLALSPDALFTTPHHEEKAEAAYHAAPDS